MNILILLMLQYPLMLSPLFNFSAESDLSNWRIVNDVVMGGRSDSDFRVNAEGHALFSGAVSLENNGGFSMVRYWFEARSVVAYRKMILRVRGDGKRYQFRVKSNSAERHAYIQHFQTSGDWEQIEFVLADLQPTFRGRALSIPNYPGELMAEIAILIGNKKAEAFQLEIDWISFE